MIEVCNKGEFSALMVNGELIMTAGCAHMTEHFARKLHQARSARHREAMRILVEDCGMCEDVAKHIYSLFFETGAERMQ